VDWQDKVCVVTGASSGIGRRTALDLAAEGARVCAAARREERLESLVAEMGGPAAGHSYVVTDVSKRKDAKALAAHVRATYDRCDVLVNNAGFSGEQPFEGPESIRALDAIMQTNFFGAVYCTAELLPLLHASTPSHVVNVSSVAGRLAFPGSSAYCASKFALVGWSEALYFELSAKDVYVSLIEPGFIPTEGFPQEAFLNDKFLRHVLGSDADVSAAIRNAVSRRKMERVVPRWYHLLQVPRLLAPPLYRMAVSRLAQTNLARRTVSQ
jgi:short-subunit dehydrogenase